MNVKLASAATALAFLSTAALAADLPSRRAPPVFAPPPIPVFTWTGFYVGGHVGYEFGHSGGLAINNVNGATAGNGANPDGVVGGAHVGYLFSTQSIPVLGSFGGAFGSAFGGGGVFGIEGDVDGANYKRAYAFGPVLNSNRQDIQGSIRGRLGVAVDRVLFYATGGAAFGGLQTSYLNTVTNGFDNFNHTKVGYTVGGGAEYAFTNNLSARVEYRYTDFGSFTDAPVNAAPGVAIRHRETDNRVQAGLSYRFDAFTLAPVVARY